MVRFRIRTNGTNSVGRKHEFELDDLPPRRRVTAGLWKEKSAPRRGESPCQNGAAGVGAVPDYPEAVDRPETCVHRSSGGVRDNPRANWARNWVRPYLADAVREELPGPGDTGGASVPNATVCPTALRVTGPDVPTAPPIALQTYRPSGPRRFTRRQWRGLISPPSTPRYRHTATVFRPFALARFSCGEPVAPGRQSGRDRRRRPRSPRLTATATLADILSPTQRPRRSPSRGTLAIIR